MNKDVSYSLYGNARLFVKENGQIIKDTGYIKNLILNAGMDQIAYKPFAELACCCVIGTGSTETRKTSNPDIINYTSGSGFNSTVNGTLTYRSASTVVFLGVNPTGSVVTTSDLNNVIKIDNDGSYNISSIISPISCSVRNLDGSIPTGVSYNNNYTIYFTNQTSMSYELYRIGKVNDNSGTPDSVYGYYGNCSSTVQSGSIRHTRVYYLNTVTATLSTTIREVGFGWSPTANSPTLFSRIRLTEGPSGSAVVLNTGQELIVLYELNIGVSPSTPTRSSSNISIDASGSVQCELYGLSKITSVGRTSYFDDGLHGNEPYYNNNYNIYGLPTSSYKGLYIYSSSDSSSFSTWGTNINRTSNYVTKSIYYTSPYTSSNYSINKIAIFNDTESINSDLRTIGIGLDYANSSKNLLTFLFDSSQNKQNGYLLNISQSFTWNRLLN
jgi:hypothetical protein